MECTGCKIEKPLSEYYTYKECGQIKPRKRCKECIKAAALKRVKNKNTKKIIAPKVQKSHQINSKVVKSEPKVEVVSIPQKKIIDPVIASNEEVAKTKICTKCNVEKHMKQYYSNRNVCRRCILTNEKINRSAKRQEELEEQGGSMRVPTKPGIYTDELQRKNTYEFLTLIGWSYNEELNIFYKLPIKDSQGNWFYKDGNSIGLSARKQYMEYYKTITPETLPTFTKLYNNAEIDLDLLNQMIYDFFILKIERKQLQEKYNLNENRVNYYIRTIYQKIHDNATKN